MNAAQNIADKIKQGMDVIFAEEHGVIDLTFELMQQTIAAGALVSAVSLELPPYIQPVIDKAAEGEMSTDLFIRQTRLSMEESALETASHLLQSGKISEEDYNAYEKFYFTRIESIISQDGVAYDPTEDTYVLGALHGLITTASAHNIPVFATDLDRENVIYDWLGVTTEQDLIRRVDDTSDWILLNEQIKLSDAGPILVHRGTAHVWDNEAYSNKGLDNYLKDSGRNIFVIGHYGSCLDLQEAFYSEQDFGNILSGSDATIIDGSYLDESDQTVCGDLKNLPEPLTINN